MPDLDLSRIKDGRAYAVHCSTRDEARAFVNRMIQEYPERCENWTSGSTYWGTYKEKTVYYPNFEYPDGRMMYGNIGGYFASRSIIVKLSDLICVPEFSIQAGDMPIDSLLGV